MSSRSVDDMGITVKVNTEYLEKVINDLDLDDVSLRELRQIIQENLVVTVVNAGPKGICFPGIADDGDGLHEC